MLSESTAYLSVLLAIVDLLFREFFSKFNSLYAAKDYTAESLAKALMADILANGLLGILFSDPGSDLTSKAVSGGFLQKIRAVCADRPILDEWDEEHVMKLVLWFLNKEPSSETGVSAFVAKFGTADAQYM